MREEPWPSSAEWKRPENWRRLPPKRPPRFPGPRQLCGHCGLVSQTSARECPVCAAPYAARGRFARALAALRRP